MRIVLVDDQPLVRAGISFILSTEPGIDVVSEAANGELALVAVAAVGWEGGLFVMEPRMKIFAAFPSWGEGAARLALCAAGIGVSMITLSSIAFMFSCLRLKPAAATILTLSILFVDMILQGFPFFKPYESWFVTWRMSSWLFLAEQHISWAKITESYALLFGLNATLFILGWLSFQTRDFKT